MRKKKILFFLMLLGLFFGNSVHADPGMLIIPDGSTPTAVIDNKVTPAAPAATAVTPATGGTVTLTNPLSPSGANVELTTLLGKIINGILGFVGAIAFAMFIWGGLQLMTARGNDKQVTSGKDTLKWAAIGLVIIFASYAAVKLIMDVVGVAPLSSS